MGRRVRCRRRRGRERREGSGGGRGGGGGGRTRIEDGTFRNEFRRMNCSPCDPKKVAGSHNPFALRQLMEVHGGGPGLEIGWKLTSHEFMPTGPGATSRTGRVELISLGKRLPLCICIQRGARQIQWTEGRLSRVGIRRQTGEGASGSGGEQRHGGERNGRGWGSSVIRKTPVGR